MIGNVIQIVKMVVVANETQNTEGTVEVPLEINGTVRHLQIEPRVTLLDALRENLGLFGTKKGCDHGQCGACTMHVNGRRINSCLTFAIMHQGDKVTTIEGLAKEGQLHPMQAAFLEHDAFQCGYCTSGQIMSAVAMVQYEMDGALALLERQLSAPCTSRLMGGQSGLWSTTASTRIVATQRALDL